MENADERWEEQEIQKILKKIRMGSREELEEICRMPRDTPCSVSVVHKRSKEENCLRTAELFLQAEAYR